MRSSLSFLLVLVLVAPGLACPDDPPAGSGASMFRSGQTCSGPSGAGSACNILSDPVFTRIPEAADGALFPVGCFAVAKIRDGHWTLFNTANGNFERSHARKGTQWFNTVPVSGLEGDWFSGVQCPDPHYLADSTMFMYFNARNSGDNDLGPWYVAYTLSADVGYSWTPPIAVVEPTETHYPYMPSVVRYAGGYLMAYAWSCVGSPVLYSAEIHVLHSVDGINWTPWAVPAVTVGNTGSWDSGTVNRPRLVLDPDQTTVHLFYSGYPWTGSLITRNCAGIGYARSTDLGQKWCKEKDPVLQPGTWDDKYVGKPTLAWEDSTQTALRLYYEGSTYGSGDKGLGAARADLADLPNPTCPRGVPVIPTSPTRSQSAAAGQTDAEHLPGRITSFPNPSRGTTTFGLELARLESGGRVEILLVDVTGRLVRELWSGSADHVPGELVWDGRDAGGALVATGRYLARARQDGRSVAAHWVTQVR